MEGAEELAGAHVVADPDAVMTVLAFLLGPFRWLEPGFWAAVWPFRQILRLFAWIGRVLSALGDL
ncbi:hypothetical protein [Nonomuraea sp. NPDC049646]|uniref:hypothetical protein n=1 Tax=unclassified Nonomuraea TaxID=2593643 RepID=UPI0037A2A723